MRPRAFLLLPLFLLFASVSGPRDAVAAAEDMLALGEVASPPPSSGVDRSTLKTAAEGELRLLENTQRPARQVVVSVAITGATKAPVACTVNAVLRDRKSGTMIAILEGRARSEGSADAELQKAVVRAAVRGAVRQIPEALASK